MARGRGEVSGFSVPAMNLRAQTFDMARTIYETAARQDVGALILEIARSEQTYTFQRPMDFATSVYAGAIAAGWQGPIFVQGDHYQFNAKKYAADPEAMTEEIRRACRLAIDAGYRNIDIDSSTLVDLSKPNLDEEQKENYTRAAELTALIRSLETDGVTVSVGGEIGEVGKVNSTVDELKAYLDGYEAVLGRLAPGARGLSKVSVQTGTSHGGVPLPGGGVAEVKLDFDVLARLGELARSRGLAGAVQHGASTLPDELFHRFPEAETAEVHLATGFQNALYEHPAFPAALMDEIYAWCQVNAADERKDGQTEDQFLYTTRKKAIGPFKRQLWDLRDQGRDPRQPGRQDRLPVHPAAGRRLARDGEQVRQARRGLAPHPARPSRPPQPADAVTTGPGTPFATPGPEPFPVRVRLETPGDEPGVRRVNLAAFTGPEEAEIVDRIRREAPEGWHSLVAVGAPDGPADGDRRGPAAAVAVPRGGRQRRPRRDGPGHRPGRGAAGAPVAGDRVGADVGGHGPRHRARRAGPGAAGPPCVLPAVRLRERPRGGPRAAGRGMAGRRVDGPPAARLDGRHARDRPLPGGVRAAGLTAGDPAAR